MAVKITCPCGKTWLAADNLMGQAVRCAACGRNVLIPAPREDELELQPVAPPQPAAPPVPGAAAGPAAARGGAGGWVAAAAGAPPPAPTQAAGTWRLRYLFFGLTLIPLFFSLFHGKQDVDDDIKTRFEASLKRQLATVSEDQQLAALKRMGDLDQKADRDEEVTLSEVLSVLPEGKLDGAFLRRDSWGHWWLAGLAAAAFFAVLLWMFPMGEATPWQLIKVGLFTGTLGIVMLLAFQFISVYSQAVGVRGWGKLAILLFLIQLIGFSYRAALDPSNGFWLSCLGFTFGVGLCEEICKALPVLWHYRRPLWPLDWRGACLWGLASGIGFGVSEGITYSSDFYNGLLSGGIYWVRFVSCVGLHSIWAAAVGISAYRRQRDLQGEQTWGSLFMATLWIIAVPMVLHGLYDTLLKKDMEFWAFVTAVASFGWLAYQFERIKSDTVNGEIHPLVGLRRRRA